MTIKKAVEDRIIDRHKKRRKESRATTRKHTTFADHYKKRRDTTVGADTRKDKISNFTTLTPRPRAHPECEEGSGNVFADMGMPNPEEALAKAAIAHQINLILSKRKLNQARAGSLLGISQPRVSDLARGRLMKFSLEKLLSFAKLLGNDVEIRISATKQEPHLTVAAIG
ncbi:MAG TPA: helix-turn-helix transcriptional regulator [Bryobacteraceae bacterium]|nr:helix-turn-helix transcriptional regulator [Bryobacteraceae bacterium]